MEGKWRGGAGEYAGEKDAEGVAGEKGVATVAQAQRFQRKEEREVREGSDEWDPSVRKKRKEKEKKERGARVVAGWAGPRGCWSRAGPVAALFYFFLLLSFFDFLF
jgi:hypothetical protein